ncbi:hypothetical protein BNJ_00157 [Kaumoebavirus]|uniref:hypothetical protein n=1 Tax=Kaumoebavirus TaxID=1859492 RepID=UPI0009C2FB79|nr:hypothetical protein BNJ_00157 [Kaumoebavirus]ARA71989.1 hypothetical protein BNJ_00157 [Kaumoebavirus]
MSVFDTLSPAEVANKMQEILMEFKKKIDGLNEENTKLKEKVVENKDLLELSRKSMDKLNEQLEEAKSDYAQMHGELEKMSKDLLAALDERDVARAENAKLKECIETLSKLGNIMEEKLKKIEDEFADRMKTTGFDYECSVENRLSLPVEIRYKDKPLTIYKSRNSSRITKMFFRMDNLVRYDELAYYVDGHQVDSSKVVSFTYKEVIAKPALYRMEILSFFFPGLIKVKIDGKDITSATDTVTVNGNGLNLVTAFKTTIRFKYAPGLKKENVNILVATIAKPEYVPYATPGAIIGDLVQL